MLNIYCTQSVNVIFTGVIDLLGGVVSLVEFKACCMLHVAHARAQEECWPKILHFLRKNLDPVGGAVSCGR